MSITDILPLIERFGIQFIIVVMLALFIWKVLWPSHEKQIEANRQLLINELKQAREDKQRDVDRFLNELEKRDTAFERVIQNMEKLTDEIRSQRTNKR